MNWELYEVWAVTDDGHEDLIDTTKDLKEARQLARANIGDGIDECVIYRENREGDLVEVERISN
jgi:hypothetical protein